MEVRCFSALCETSWLMVQRAARRVKLVFIIFCFFLNFSKSRIGWTVTTTSRGYQSGLKGFGCLTNWPTRVNCSSCSDRKMWGYPVLPPQLIVVKFVSVRCPILPK